MPAFTLFGHLLGVWIPVSVLKLESNISLGVLLVKLTTISPCSDAVFALLSVLVTVDEFLTIVVMLVATSPVPRVV